MREPTIYISTDGSVPSQRYAIDDPAIIEALAIAQAARDAGLVVDGKLKPPTCYWSEYGDDAVDDPGDDLQCSYGIGCVLEYRAAWGGKREWWTLDKDGKPVGPFATKSEAEQAAEAAKGAPDAQG
jgi:hypothetical protein